jgi:hypothetical protein
VSRRTTRASAHPRSTAQRSQRWLLLVHQLPPHPSNLRVRTWRRLQQIGALPVKQAVYVLPDTATTREDFEWLKAEITSAGGEATVFSAASIDNWTDVELVDTFKRARQKAYDALAGDVERALKHRSKSSRSAAPGRTRGIDSFRQQLAAIERIDFFGSPGRERVDALLQQLEEPPLDAAGRAATSVSPRDRRTYRGRTWVTRPRPGVDRMASSWLIRRFIDPQARFAFADDRKRVPAGAILFDMFGVELSHHGDRCTFETLCSTFGLETPTLTRLAEVVHDLDLKDGRYGAPETPALGALVDGLQRAHRDDDDLLARGMAMFEALYLSFEASRMSSGRAGRQPSNRRT